MNEARELLLTQSYDHLFTARWAVESAFGESPTEDLTAEVARDFGYTFFGAINELLKLCLDMADQTTFSEVERQWARMFDDMWLPGFPSETLSGAWSERRGGEPAPQLLALLRRREVLRLGLVMWAAHLLAKPQPTDRQAELSQAFQQLASRFPDMDWVLDAFDAAQGDEGEAAPWTTWFLSELPSGDAYFIPTTQELLRATLLLCARFVTPEQPASLRPREWLDWRHDEIRKTLDQLREAKDRWQPAIGTPETFLTGELSATEGGDGWQQRLDRLELLFVQGRRAQQESERARVRTAPIDEERVDALRHHTLREAAGSRVLRDTVEVHGGVIALGQSPEGHEGLVARSWAPRGFFTPDSRVVGLDLMARDLARPVRDAERQQLVAALPQDDFEETDEGEVASALTTVIRRMRSDGFDPTLIVLPLNWRLERALGLEGLGALPVDHELVPPLHRREFSGVFDDVPALDLVGMPPDRVWVLDLAQAIRFEEWPSDERSGLRFEFQSFDEEGAAELLAAQPSVASPGRSPEEARLDLQERVLISLHLCWRILPGQPGAASALSVPDELRRE